jgi:hypothetical protein
MRPVQVFFNFQNIFYGTDKPTARENKSFVYQSLNIFLYCPATFFVFFTGAGLREDLAIAKQLIALYAATD